MLSCSSGGASGGAGAAAGTGAAPGSGGATSGGGIACAQQGSTCSCEWSTSGASGECFASAIPACASPNLCCWNGVTGPGYYCSCAPPVPGGWSCVRRPGRAAGWGKDDWCACGAALAPEPGDIPIPPEQCVGVWVAGVPYAPCHYDATADECVCTNPGMLYSPSTTTDVDTCATRPPGVKVNICPAGLMPVPAVTPGACDGKCHAETCFGSAAEECDAYGCSARQWTCSADQCIKIPFYGSGAPTPPSCG